MTMNIEYRLSNIAVSRSIVSSRRHALVLLGIIALCLVNGSSPPPSSGPWGSDHVGKPVPEYVTGDECLFCHRDKIGPSWGSNWHNRTVRDADPTAPGLTALVGAAELKHFATDIKAVLGGRQRVCFLKPAAAYGKLDLLSVSWQPPQGAEAGKLLNTKQPHWDTERFGAACAGCHATAVDSKERAFSARSLECYVCHGEVSLEHSKNTALVHLSRKRKDSARVVTSICAQCHVRTGKSRSAGLPYPNNFVAGDNLFRDFQVDLSPGQIKRQNPADAHVLENVRNVELLGQEEVTCLSCHDVHKESTKRHHLVPQSDLCLHCHNATGSKKLRKAYEVHSQTCDY
jgi:predicted CXXCH cytochrome family protein